MKNLLRQNIPEDFVYYRTGSEIFYQYSKKFFWWDIVEVPEHSPQFLRIERFFWWKWNWIEAEKIDEEPDITLLKSIGYAHGIVFWAPLRRVEKPKWWLRIPSYFARRILHSSHSAFLVLEDGKEYFNKWSSKARNHRKHFLEGGAKGSISIRPSQDINMFYTLYKEAQIGDPNKKIHLQWLERMMQIETMENIRIYLWYIGEKPVAWALFLDMGTTSEYFMSFYPPESRQYQFGIGFMDTWMADSQKLWIQYCDLDHMWDFGSPRKQKWYTEFKSNIAEHDVYFHDMWVKIF